jgi:hypothetical protein
LQGIFYLGYAGMQYRQAAWPGKNAALQPYSSGRTSVASQVTVVRLWLFCRLGKLQQNTFARQRLYHFMRP